RCEQRDSTRWRASGGTRRAAAIWAWPTSTAGAFAAMSPGRWRYTVRPATQGRPWDVAIWTAPSNWTDRSDLRVHANFETAARPAGRRRGDRRRDGDADRRCRPAPAPSG